MKKQIILFGFSVYASVSFATVYDTLPKGVDMFVMKQVMTSKIESKYDADHENNPYMFKENFTSNKLEGISSAVQAYFNELKAISPDAYNQFSLGEFQASATASVTAQGLGLARGITDHLTVYGSLPIYHIKTDVTFRQTQKSNLPAIQAAVQNSTGDNTALSTFVRQLTLQLPETNEQLLQSIVVNYYGYKARGKWEKDALGDAELGAIYRFTDFDDRGFSLAVGTVLPTGDADDPDSIQDVSTGDGQVDAFVESMAGISFFNNAIQFDLKTRFTYQFASKKSMRTYTDPDLPLSQNKEAMSEKLGNKIDATLTMTYNPTIWLNFNTSLLYSSVGVSQYSARDAQVAKALADGTATESEWVRIGAGYSSVEMYKAKRAEIPFEINLSAQQLVNAKSTPDYQRYDLEFRLYF